MIFVEYSPIKFYYFVRMERKIMNANAREVFVSNLKYWMKKRNKEQADISRDLNINISTVSSWYNGVAYPRVDKMQLLADYLNVPMRYLTDDIPEKSIAIPDHFNSAQDAISFILRQPLVADYGGYDLSKMSDEDIVAFANEIAGMIQYAAKLRYARKEQEGETT